MHDRHLDTRLSEMPSTPPERNRAGTTQLRKGKSITHKAQVKPSSSKGYARTLTDLRKPLRHPTVASMAGRICGT